MTETLRRIASEVSLWRCIINQRAAVDRTSKNTRVLFLPSASSSVRAGWYARRRQRDKKTRRRRADEDEDVSKRNATVVDEDDQSVADRRALLNRISMIASVRNPEAL